MSRISNDSSFRDGQEADDLYHTAGNKGQMPGGGKKSLGRQARGRRKKREPGRGHYDKDRPAIIAWVSRQGAVVIQATRDFTVKTVQKAADLAVQAGSRLYTDSASSYRAVKGYLHVLRVSITEFGTMWWMVRRRPTTGGDGICVSPMQRVPHVHGLYHTTRYGTVPLSSYAHE